MSDEEYAELKRDIAAHGQIELVTLHEGAILDGRNRYRACMELGITPNTETFHANGLSALDYVIAPKRLCGRTKRIPRSTFQTARL